MHDKKTIAVVGATGAQGGGVVRAALAAGDLKVRAITRNPDSEKAGALAGLGAEVVAGDADAPATLDAAFAGADAAFVVTNFWEHGSPERELEQASALARATKRAGVGHVVWSTLEDTRKWFPIGSGRLPTLKGRYNVPHFDAKGEADAVFAAEGAPTSFVQAVFYWDNFIYFGSGPRRGEDGKLVLALPLGGTPLPGIAAADIGKSALGILARGAQAVGETFGIAGEILTGEEMAAAMSRHLGETVTFQDVPFEIYRNLGFPGADDLANMFEFHALLGDEFLARRSPAMTRELAPATQDFETWLAANAAKIPLD